MQSGIERLANRINPLEPGGFKLLPELPVDQHQGLVHDIVLSGLTTSGDHPIQIVKHIQELDRQSRLGPLREFFALPGRTLAEVVKLRGQT